MSIASLPEGLQALVLVLMFGSGMAGALFGIIRLLANRPVMASNEAKQLRVELRADRDYERQERIKLEKRHSDLQEQCRLCMESQVAQRAEIQELKARTIGLESELTKVKLELEIVIRDRDAQKVRGDSLNDQITRALRQSQGHP